jgi:signal transduction histidine kinase
MRDEFISIASHELKTPLTSLRLQTQLSQRKIALGDAQIYEPATTRKLVESTGKQVDRLVHLVEDMLDVSRLNLKKLHLRIEEFDLAELIAETVDRMQPQAAVVGCRIDVFATTEVKGNWDRFRVEQIVTNLLSNAIRYCPGLPIEVTVSREGEIAKVSVRDYGPGIALDNQGRIFERFERGASGGSASGMGIGLYICREIATAHGGSVTLQSELSKGSVFTLMLPLS